MDIHPLSLRGLREQAVLAQCETFAVMLTLGEFEASGLGRQARPAATTLPTVPAGTTPRGAVGLPQAS